MILDKVKYCTNDVAIKRLKYIILKYTDDSIVDRYVERDAEYTLFYNTRYGTTLLLRKRDNRIWEAVFKTNYTRRQYLYCLLAARLICKNVHIIVNDVDDTSLLDEARLIDEAGYKFRLVDKITERCDAFSNDDDILNSIPIDFPCFIVEEDNTLPKDTRVIEGEIVKKQKDSRKKISISRKK